MLKTRLKNLLSPILLIFAIQFSFNSAYAGVMHEIECKRVLINLEVHAHAALGLNELFMKKQDDGEEIVAQMWNEKSTQAIALAADWAAVYSALCK